MEKNTSILLSSGPRMSHIPYILSSSISKDFFIDFLIGIYPTRYLQYVLKSVLPSYKYLKLMARLQQISDDRVSVHLNIIGEVSSHLMSLAKSYRLPKYISNAFAYASSYFFSLQAIKLLNSKSYTIYHYRCSFGLNSLDTATRRGVIKLCDHSIAHPSLNHHLCLNQGSFPSNPSAVSSSSSGDIIHRLMLSDIAKADHIIVNSVFVHETMTYMGIPATKMSVVVLPVEKQFLAMAEQQLNMEKKLPVRNILFAGSFTDRKGVNTLIAAFSLLSNDFTLRIAGVSIGQLKAYCDKNGFSNDRIHALGYLTRRELLSEMLRTRIFVFPSLCEGYAKVVQEAMACGCFIIATHNSGFSTSDGQSGIVVKPGDAFALADSIEKASWLSDIDMKCRSNSAYAMNNYNIDSYDSNIRKVYELLASRQSKQII